VICISINKNFYCDFRMMLTKYMILNLNPLFLCQSRKYQQWKKMRMFFSKCKVAYFISLFCTSQQHVRLQEKTDEALF